MSLRRGNLAMVGGLAALLAVIALSAPLWLKLLRRPVAATDDETGAPAASPEPGEAAGAGRRISVKLLFPSAERAGLVIEEREVAYSPELPQQLLAVAREVVNGPAPGGPAPLLAAVPAGTQVLDVFVNERGTAFLDLSGAVRLAASPSPAAETGPAAATTSTTVPPSPVPSPSPFPMSGSHAELLTVYALVNSLVLNFPAVKRVQILVDDRPATTLFGHVDVSRPLSPDLSLLAAAEVTEQGTASPAPPAASPAAN